jgi:O-antigen ligase
VALVLFYAVRAGKVSPGRLALVALVGLFLSTLALASLGLVNDEIARRLGSLGSLAEDDTVVFRYGVWSIGLDLIQKYPLGIGFQAFRGLTGYTAHNQYILWALGTGVAGLGAVVVMLAGWLSRMFVTVGRRHQPALTVSLASFGAVVGGLLSINGDNISSSMGWTQNTLWIFLATGAAAYSGARRANRSSLRSNREPGRAQDS